MAGTDFVIASQIPRGLEPAIEGLAREILRQQPRDIYTFAAQHFEGLVKLRDKEHTSRITPKILDRKSLNESDFILDYTGYTNNSNFNSGKVRKDHPRTYKYGNLIDEAMVVKAKRMGLTTTRKTILPKKKDGMMYESGWSINRTMNVLKRYDYRNDTGKLCNTRIDDIEKAIRKTIPDNSEQCSSRLSKKIARGQLIRSLSTGNTLARSSNHRLEENRDKFNVVAIDKHRKTSGKHGYGKSYEDVNSLKRQRSADQIERICMQFGDSNGDARIVGRRRSRSLVNNNNDWYELVSAVEKTRRQCAIEGARPGNREATAAILNLRLKEKNEEESRSNEKGETYTGGSQCDLTRTNVSGDSVIDVTAIDRTISVILPSVVTRPSSDKYTKEIVYEFDEQNGSSNFTLPPISSDMSQPIKDQLDVTLPSLSSNIDVVRLNEWSATRCYGDVISNDGREEFRGMTDFTSNDSKTDQEECKDETLYSRNKEDEIISLKDPCHEYKEGTIELDSNIDTKDLENLEIMRCSLSQELDIEDAFKDSLNVTPVPVEFSQRPDSLEEQKEEEERQPNELKRKLIEIEAVEKSIENTLVTSRRSTPCDHGLEESHSIEVPAIDLNSEQSDGLFENKENKEIPVTDRKEEMYVDDEQVQIDPSKCQNLQSDANNKDGNDEIDEDIKAPMEFDNSSYDNSTIAIDGNVNNDTSNAEEALDKSLKGTDPTCYVLTEGSPCEIPETVTTVIIPGKILDDDVYDVRFDEIADDVEPCLGESTSVWNGETQKGSEEEDRNETDAFGEYVHPEIFDCPTSVDAQRLLSDVKDVDRATAHQDLGNIKEEEDNECSISNEADVQDVDFDSSMKISKLPEDKNDIECKEHLTSFDDREQNYVNIDEETSIQVLESTNTTDKRSQESVENEEHTNNESEKEDDTRTEQKEQGEETPNDPSLDETRIPHVPELNLDSLGDVTVSSFQRNESVDFESQSGKDNGNVTSCDVENISLSSFANSWSVREKSITDDHLPFSEDKLRKATSEDGTTETRSETEKCSKLEFQSDVPNNAFVRDNDETDSRQVEEEIARELIENFIRDASAIGETNIEARNANLNEINDSLAPTITDQVTNVDNETDYPLIKYPTDPQELTVKSIDEEYSGREESDNNAEALGNEEEEQKQGKEGTDEMGEIPGVGTERENEKEDREDDEAAEEEQREGISFSGNEGKKEISSLRHTGEFHDSLLLPLIELPRNVSTADNYVLETVCETRDHVCNLQPDISENKKCTSAFSTTPIDTDSSQMSATPYTIDLLEKCPLLDNKADWTKLPLNVSRCIIRFERLRGDENHTNVQTAIPLPETSLSSNDTDDVREPLALDNTPKPVIIEEISDVDEEEK
ncbi:uncharacterized protein LOC143426709 [Xylocopa sonorina]|uniref:uncharacterized protein LOC143426709 n=1 Tax=Xylocopa sonorina TaxID=1818115 RepID=UPI00403AF3C5